MELASGYVHGGAVNVLDLFSGIGGFSLGLERAGMRTVAFCEIDPYARAVLRKHWPGVPCYDDVRTLSAARLAADGIGPVDVICGGFPCQDISTAGKGAGLAGERSGLWSEIARLVGELRPRYVIVENVAALLGRGLGDVLGDLAEVGYDAEWHCIPASYVGAPHRRDRIWIIGYPNAVRHSGAMQEAPRASGRGAAESSVPSAIWDVAHPSSQSGDGRDDYTGVRMEAGPEPEPRDGRGAQDVADAISQRQPRPGQPVHASHPAAGTIGEAVNAVYGRVGEQWATEPNVGRVANGVPARVDRLRCLGNAVVPQIPEILGRAIMAADEAGAATK